jgi:hypothetical protein
MAITIEVESPFSRAKPGYIGEAYKISVSSAVRVIDRRPRECSVFGCNNINRDGIAACLYSKTYCWISKVFRGIAHRAQFPVHRVCRPPSWPKAPSAPPPRYDKRGRPGQGTPPDQAVSQLEGALAIRIAARQALIDQHGCFILATNELDDTLFSPQKLLAGHKGQARAERGFRFLKDPQFLASSLYLQKPERIMALLMVITVCLLVYAALEYQIRQALKEHEATFPDQKGKRIQNPTARWVFY